MKRLQKHTILIMQLLIVLCLFTPPVCVAYYVWSKHQLLESKLNDLAPRYARLNGLAEKKADFELLIATLEQDMARWAHPIVPSEPSKNLGAEIQEKLRGILIAQKLTVVSFQLLPPKVEKYFETFSIEIKIEGDMASLTAGISEIEKIEPAVRMDLLTIQTIGPARPASNPRLSAQMTLSVFRGIAI